MKWSGEADTTVKRFIFKPTGAAFIACVGATTKRTNTSHKFSPFSEVHQLYVALGTHCDRVQCNELSKVVTTETETSPAAPLGGLR